jgi:hypothetical protein
VLNVSGARALQFVKNAPEQHPVNAIMAVPLRIRARNAGYIVAMRFDWGRRFDEGQRKLLASVASRAAAAIENARLYEDLKATFNQTIQGLARAIDKMDRYTAGHSDRVATYARLLAQKLGLGPEQVEIVRQAALMHDIGKIGCVLNLNKAGKLSSRGLRDLQEAPGVRPEILEPIKFLHPILPGVHAHHERWDGTGLPRRPLAQRDPAHRADHLRGRHLRRDDQRPQLSPRAAPRGRDQRDRALRREPVRPRLREPLSRGHRTRARGARRPRRDRARVGVVR